MKKIIILLALILCGCSVTAKENYLPVNDVLTLSVRVKDGMEYIPVDQWSTPEDVDFLPYLEIETNKDDVEISYKWVGAGFANQFEKYEDIIGKSVTKKLEAVPKDELLVVDEELIEQDRIDTLTMCGFMPASIFITAKTNELSIEQKLDTLLFLIPRENGDGFFIEINRTYAGENNDMKSFWDSMNGKTIDEIQRLVAKKYSLNLASRYFNNTTIITEYISKYSFSPQGIW